MAVSRYDRDHVSKRGDFMAMQNQRNFKDTYIQVDIASVLVLHPSTASKDSYKAKHL